MKRAPPGYPVDVRDARLLRIRVAMRALLLALEACAYKALDGSRDTPSVCIRLIDEVPERFSACRDLLHDNTRAMPTKHRVTLDRMRASLEHLEQAHHAFERADDRQAAALALLEAASDVRSESETWI